MAEFPCLTQGEPAEAGAGLSTVISGALQRAAKVPGALKRSLERKGQ